MSAATTSRRPSKQGDEDEAAINSALDRMRAWTPADPYVLTIPQHVEPRYHHGYKYQATQWLDHTPFEQKEHESIQYQTFNYHEPGGVYMLHSSRPGDVVASNGHKAGVATGANTPSGSTAPKKKISLNDYKLKQGAAATPERKESEQQAKQPAVKGPIERLKADEEVLAAVKGVDDLLALSPPKEDKKDLKRKREENVVAEQAIVNDDKQAEHSETGEPTKKARRTSPSSQLDQDRIRAEQTQSDETQRQSNVDKASPSPRRSSKDFALPPKLSPPLADSVKSRLPPKLSPASQSLLPPKLSPELPANIVATLKAQAQFRSASRSSDAPGSRSASKDRATRHLTPPPKSIPRNGFRANSASPAVHSDAEARGRSKTSQARQARSPPDLDTETSENIVVSKGGEKAKQQAHRSSPFGQRKLLVKLKYKKSQKELIRRLLNLRPNPDKSLITETDSEDADTVTAKDVRRPSKSDARQRENRNADAKGVAQKVRPTAAVNGTVQKDDKENGDSMGRKRIHSNDSDLDNESPSKRKKTATDKLDSGTREPSTPTSHRPNSQSVPNTIRKDLLSASMKREPSNDSSFGGSLTLSQTSPSVQGGHTRPPNGTPQTANRISTPLEKAWRSERERLESLGKDLKRAATEHSNSAHSSDGTKQPVPTHNKKLAATKSLEAFLSFLLAFIADDQACLAADPKLPPSLKLWRSLQGFYGFVKRHCEPFPHLYGLACALGMVFTARILDLATQQRPENNAEHTATIPVSQHDGILDAAAMMRRAANEADAKLDLDVLQTSFPRAWAGRTKGSSSSSAFLDNSKEILEPGKGFEGKYKLPFGVQMTPLNAVRAAYAVLDEWISQEEGLGYEMKLKL